MMPKHIRIALLAASITFVVGFGAMFLLYRTGSWPAGLRGLYSYKSATYGDGLLVPLLIAILINTYLSLPHYYRDARTLIFAAVPGIFIGAISQWLWLQNPNPSLNWTLPTPHTFNYAGWYHAGFLIMVSGFISSLTIGILVGFRRLARQSPSDFHRMATSPWVTILAADVVSFLALLSADNRSSASSSSRTETFAVIFIALALIVLLAGLIVGRPILILSRNLYVGAIGAIGVAVLLMSVTKYGLQWYEIGLALLIAMSGSIMTRSDVGPFLVALSMCASFSWVLLALALPHYRSSLTYAIDIVLLGAVAVSVPVVQARSTKQLWSWLKCAFAPELVVICYLITRWFFRSGTQGVSVGVGALLGALTIGVANHVKRDFAVITHTERLQPPSDEIRTRQLWFRSWGHFAGLAVASVPIVAYFTITGPDSTSVPPHDRTAASFRLVLIGTAVGLGCVVVATAVILSAVQAGKLMRRKRFENVGGPALGYRRYFSQSLLILGATLQFVVYIYAITRNFTSSSPLTSAIAALISALLTLWVFESIIANTCSLQGWRSSMFPRVVSCLVALNAGACCFYVIRFGIISVDGKPLALPIATRSLLLLFQIVILSILTSIIVLTSKPAPHRNTQYPEYFGVVQDELLVIALVILAGILPVYVWSKLSLSINSMLDAFGYCVPLLVPFGLLFYMAIEENRKHLGAEIASTSALSVYDTSMAATGRRELIKPLAAHIRFQNLFALILVVLSVVPLLTLANRDNPVTEYWQVLRQSFW